MTTAVATNKLSGKWIGWLTSLLGGLFVAWCFYDPSTPKVNLYWFGTIMAIGMFAFDLLPNFVTAVLLLMYYILTGIAAPDVAFVGWTTPIPWLCMCGMLIGVLMEKTRLANRIALFTISRVGTTPIRMYIAFLLAGFIVSAIIPDVITVDILFMAIATGMCQSLNLSVTSRSATTIVLPPSSARPSLRLPTCPTTRASSACSWSRTWASRSHGWASTAKICLTRSARAAGLYHPAPFRRA